MQVRIFRCSCNHRMRYGAKSCGYCFRTTPLYNRTGLVVTVVAIAAAIAALTVPI